jgi:predicted HicB family RNase H-like nuclease
MLRSKNTERREKKKYPTLNIRMSDAVYAQVRRVANAHGASMAWVVNQCLKRALPKMASGALEIDA